MTNILMSRLNAFVTDRRLAAMAKNRSKEGF
jgi:hypothetical protein